ncbi:Signal transduction histidine-protein kinase BaeS [Pantoea agglomerans]|uniref:Signal transduction histidine-protein kinase BaeS n=2 Tax=Enterobacter agglomerans TaxID=549 RepID=A0A379ADP2_ENTAG|nr:Signal transduction histidine-protein kinase BaeS [Pantoea agglomerans]
MQLFTNLLENSLRYTDSGGRVEVTLNYEAPNWRIEF